MRIKTHRVSAIAAIATLSITLAACGGAGAPASEQEATTGSGTVDQSPAASSHNAADTEFVQMMIVHHQGAVGMAELARANAVDSEVRTLADQIVRAQGPEIELLSGWLDSWGEALPDMTAHGGMDHGGMDMEGMDQTEAMEHLGQLSSTEFDRRFLELMTAHHQGAVEMSQRVIDEGQNIAVRELAGKIIDDQEAEIDVMRTFLQRL